MRATVAARARRISGRIARVEPWSTRARRAASTSTCSRARRCAATRSATRTRGRSGSTRRPRTRPSPTAASRSIYLIQGHTGQLDMWRNRSAFRPNVPELVDRLFADGGLPAGARRVRRRVDVVRRLAVPRLAGRRQLPHVSLRRGRPVRRRALPHARGAAHRGITGKSSGGYGAMVTPMLRPDLFGGLATHAGDALFELCYLPDFRDAARALRDAYDGSFDAFWDGLPQRVPPSRRARTSRCSTRGRWPPATRRTTTARSTCRSRPRPASCATTSGSAGSPGIRCAWPTRHADALRGLRAIYIDSGKRDQFFLDLGAEAFSVEPRAARRHRRLLRALRRHAQLHRVPLPDRAALSRRATQVAP